MIDFLFGKRKSLLFSTEVKSCIKIMVDSTRSKKVLKNLTAYKIQILFHQMLQNKSTANQFCSRYCIASKV